MGPLLQQAIDNAGLTEAAERVRQGQLPSTQDRLRLADADLFVVSALANLLRVRLRDDLVTLVDGELAHTDLDATVVDLDLHPEHGITGQEALLQVALTRMHTPPRRSVAVGWEACGLELAQTAILFGADVLWGRLRAGRGLPLADGDAGKGRDLLSGLVRRAGCRARWWQPRPDLRECP